ncbi:MAG: hypothetical protein LH632_16015 [Rhodoferax sp.]|nr:hypothetical protein [Rhodoferax sp.]
MTAGDRLATCQQGYPMYNQYKPNRMLAGIVCGILGYGGIRQATARLVRAFGARIPAINRSGTTSDLVDRIGTTGHRDRSLAAADVLLVSAPLTRDKPGLVGAAQRCRPWADQCDHPAYGGAQLPQAIHWRDVLNLVRPQDRYL